MRARDFIQEESDPQWTRGKQVDWTAFLANLAKVRLAEKIPESAIDGILWLGIAGDPDTPSLFSQTHKPARIDHDRGGLLPFKKRELGRFVPVTGTITINKDKYPTWDNQVHGVLAHELRHRGFHIVRNNSKLMSLMPDDLQQGLRTMAGTDPRSLEHLLIYSMDKQEWAGVYKDHSDEFEDLWAERKYWQKRYLECARAAADWIQTGPLPKGAPEALKKELKRAYGEE